MTIYITRSKSNPIYLWPLRLLLRVMKRHDMNNKKIMTIMTTKRQRQWQCYFELPWQLYTYPCWEGQWVAFKKYWTNGVNFETWDPSDFWSEWYLDKKTKRRKNRYTKGQKKRQKSRKKGKRYSTFPWSKVSKVTFCEIQIPLASLITGRACCSEKCDN